MFLPIGPVKLLANPDRIPTHAHVTALANALVVHADLIRGKVGAPKDILVLDLLVLITGGFWHVGKPFEELG
ncbi:hypothetical protein ADUPG1_005727, partial [Aduncisulcus paluster]